MAVYSKLSTVCVHTISSMTVYSRLCTVVHTVLVNMEYVIYLVLCMSINALDVISLHLFFQIIAIFLTPAIPAVTCTGKLLQRYICLPVHYIPSYLDSLPFNYVPSYFDSLPFKLTMFHRILIHYHLTTI